MTWPGLSPLYHSKEHGCIIGITFLRSTRLNYNKYQYINWVQVLVCLQRWRHLTKMHDSTNTWRSWTSTPAFGWACRDDRNLTNTYVAQQPGSVNEKQPPHFDYLLKWAEFMLVRNMQHVRPSVVIFLGSHDLATRNLEISFNLQLEALHTIIRRSEAFEWTLDRHTLPLWSRDVETGDSTFDINFRVYFLCSVSRSDSVPVQCGRVILVATVVSSTCQSQTNPFDKLTR